MTYDICGDAQKFYRNVLKCRNCPLIDRLSNHSPKAPKILLQGNFELIAISKEGIVLPVPFGGAAPWYSVNTFPDMKSIPGILTTSQCCHSRMVGTALLGTSGSVNRENVFMRS